MKDELIALAKEAGCQEPYPVTNKNLERFARLVAAKEREKILAELRLLLKVREL